MLAFRMGQSESAPQSMSQEKGEDGELQDPIDELREKCAQSPEAVKYFQKLEECNSRVESKSETEETCWEELHDYVHKVDHCVAHSLFSKLK